MAKKQKFYVVWAGEKTGIFRTWNECSKQISGYPDAKYKSFANLEMAKMAFAADYKDFAGKKTITSKRSAAEIAALGKPNPESIAVDGAWNTATGIIEYQGVYTKNAKMLFHVGPYADGTNNIAEFLALVHGLALLKKKESNLPVYSDSMTAISWVRNKKAKTNQRKTAKNKELFCLMQRAEKWLKENSYRTVILKWHTDVWGEIPADFGRK